jgi:uncharacterized protein (DUF924 family)
MEFESVLEFWFGRLDSLGRADPEHTARWWKKDASFDLALRQRFAIVHEALANGEHSDWLAIPRGRLAFVIVLDQFSRNMFRDTPRMFAYDRAALLAAREGVAQGAHRPLAQDERPFLYMPFMHSEDLADQELCVSLFAALRDELPLDEGKHAGDQLSFAQRHFEIIKRFSRFPHRNALLGRASTPEEIEFLSEPGSSF